MSEFDFDCWCELAERDPEAFFRARRRAIERLIDSYPPRQREYLRDMQRHIDCVRACAGTPVNALCCLAVMMQDRLMALQRQNEVLRALAVKLRHSVDVD